MQIETELIKATLDHQLEASFLCLEIQPYISPEPLALLTIREADGRVVDIVVKVSELKEVVALL